MNNKFIMASIIAFCVGVLFIIASVPQAIFNITLFMRSYLFAYLFWLELSLGSMALLMIYFLTGGGWAVVTWNFLKSSMRTIYLMAILFIPVICGFQKLYPWADPAKLNLADFAHKSVYFNFSFFIARALFYLASWILMAIYLHRQAKPTKFSAFGLVYLGISGTWAAIDWQMSLDPLWISTIYGLIFLIGQALGAWTFILLVLRILLPRYPSISVSTKVELDLGNLLLTIVILWAYVSFMQYLIVWSGNLPEEVTWFGKRMRHGWEWLMLLLFCFLFAAPFVVLLFRKLKTNRPVMILLLAIILLFRVLERYWMIMPSFGLAPGLSYSDISLLLGIGGIWLSLFIWFLSRNALFATENPEWPHA